MRRILAVEPGAWASHAGTRGNVIGAATVSEQGPLGAIVLAAGLGTRMRSTRAKVLHELGGQPLLRYPLAAVGGLGAGSRRGGRRPPGRRRRSRWRRASGLPGIRAVLQEEQRGTGHAVRCALPALDGFSGDVLILYGDVPLIRAETLRRLVDTHRAGSAPTCRSSPCGTPTRPATAGSCASRDGRVRGIVEERDATPAERAITEVNPGFYCVRAEVLRPLLAALRDDNAQREFYLTDIVGLAAQGGRSG